MRSRESLIQVLTSVNARPESAGLSPWGEVVLHEASRALAGDKFSKSEMTLLRANLPYVAKHARSEHIRELAAEALHYLQEDAHGRQVKN